MKILKSNKELYEYVVEGYGKRGRNHPNVLALDEAFNYSSAERKYITHKNKKKKKVDTVII